jgi:glycosyltransferase involved in cell wall biosynthesis
MKVALVHDWLTGMRGGERVLEEICKLYPDATLYTLIHHKGNLSPAIERMKVVESSLPKLPLAHDHFRLYLPLFPRLIEQLDLSGHDLIISSSHCVAKGVIPPQGAVHFCYCHTPMRYVWDMYHAYKQQRGPLAKLFLMMNRRHLQMWDVESSSRVDHFIANSAYVGERIRRHYNRAAGVIHPPVNADFFTPGGPDDGEFYLVVSALVPYKRVDLALESFRRSGKPLVVVGTGSDEERIWNMKAPNISFLGNVDDHELREYYRRAKALIFPGEEDFGITPLESMACGRPVIAYARGGALETVIDGETGVFFDEQTVESLTAAVDKFEQMKFTKQRLRTRAESFSRESFSRNLQKFIASQLEGANEGRKRAQTS